MERVGVVDSGVGGLSILEAINHKMPQIETIYIADQQYLPYGEKKDQEIIQRAQKITEFLASKNCSLVVLACNSMTVSAIDYLRRKFQKPFVGTEPAVKPAAESTRTGEISLLLTRKTAESKKQRDLIRDHASQVSVRIFQAPEFVDLVESCEVSTSRARKTIKDFFQKTDIGKSDILVLGCTHYIFLKTQFQRHLGSKVRVMEPSLEVAQQAFRLLNPSKALKKKSKRLFYTTADPTFFQKQLKVLIKEKPDLVKAVSL